MQVVEVVRATEKLVLTAAGGLEHVAGQGVRFGLLSLGLRLLMPIAQAFRIGRHVRWRRLQAVGEPPALCQGRIEGGACKVRSGHDGSLIVHRAMVKERAFSACETRPAPSAVFRQALLAARIAWSRR
jgi:hypothetical protein